MAPTEHEEEGDASGQSRPGENPMFLVLHREAMAFGLPLGVATSLAPVGLFGFMLTRNPVFGAMLFVLLLLVLRALTAWDANFVRVLQLWSVTYLESRNGRRWGGAACAPLRAHRPLNAQQVPTHV